MRASTLNTAVLLLAYGGPDSLDDIPIFLHNVRGGRPVPQKLIDTVTERYRQIGGGSPQLAIMRSIATKLEGETGLPVYLGTRHWHPFIADTLAKMALDGAHRVVAVCMAPHYSELSVGAYQRSLNEALGVVDGGMTLHFVESWYDQPDYLAGLAANVRVAIERFPAEVRDQVNVIFTGHSLPVSALPPDDPYDTQLRETARLVAEQVGLPSGRWQYAYQSAPRTGELWLGPSVEDRLAESARDGKRNLVIAPVGFLTDHVETLYDIDIALAGIAQRHGIRMARMPMLNDSPALVAALASLTQDVLMCRPS